MKFALNHHYKFVSWEVAWLCGFLQTTATLMIETASIGVICAGTDTISIIFNFIALTILATFDNFVYDSLKNESFKELVTKEFVRHTIKIEHTTSKRCSREEMSCEIDEEGR
jgi:hypothetical protein